MERYLQRLGWWTPASCRSDLVAEARRHLYDATRHAEEAGASHDAAQRAAVRAFGPAWWIGLAIRQADGSLWFGWLLWLDELRRRRPPLSRVLRWRRRSRWGAPPARADRPWRGC